MLTIRRPIQHLIDNVIARSYKTDRQQTFANPQSQTRRRFRWIKTGGDHDARKNEYVLEPVIDASNLDMPPKRRTWFTVDILSAMKLPNTSLLFLKRMFKE